MRKRRALTKEEVKAYRQLAKAAALLRKAQENADRRKDTTTGQDAQRVQHG